MLLLFGQTRMKWRQKSEKCISSEPIQTRSMCTFSQYTYYTHQKIFDKFNSNIKKRRREQKIDCAALFSSRSPSPSLSFSFARISAASSEMQKKTTQFSCKDAQRTIAVSVAKWDFPTERFIKMKNLYKNREKKKEIHKKKNKMRFDWIWPIHKMETEFCQEFDFSQFNHHRPLDKSNERDQNECKNPMNFQQNHKTPNLEKLVPNREKKAHKKLSLVLRWCNPILEAVHRDRNVLRLVIKCG